MTAPAQRSGLLHYSSAAKRAARVVSWLPRMWIPFWPDFFPAKTLLWAKAIGPNGYYKAAESAVFNSSDTKAHERAQEAIEIRLSADGWELTAAVGHFRGPVYRRRAK